VYLVQDVEQSESRSHLCLCLILVHIMSLFIVQSEYIVYSSTYSTNRFWRTFDTCPC